jgi:hypothetical protein
MPSLSDEEGAALHAELVKYNHGARIVHLLLEFAPAGPPFNLNSKSRDDGKLLSPTATIIPDGYRLVVA